MAEYKFQQRESKVKKILFVHHNSSLGGAELSLIDLISNLSDDIRPISAVPNGPLSQSLKSRKIPTFIVPMRPIVKSVNPAYWILTCFNCLRVIFKLIGICRKEKIQVIHANGLTAGIYAAPVSFISRIPLLWHERDLARHPVLTPTIAKSASHIIAISNAVANNLKVQLGENKKICLIYNGIDVDRFQSAKPGDTTGFPGLPAGKKIVLMAAQFVQWKMHNDFIIMASYVVEKIPNAFFVLAGDRKITRQHQYIQELERTIAEKGLKDQFLWTGYVEDMPRLLRNVDCVVLPADHEPFGRIVAEAMAVGKPVVSVKSGAIPEIIEDGVSGYLLKPGDCRSMAGAVCRLLQDRELSGKMGEKGRFRISKEFTIQRTVREFEKLIKCI